MDKTERSSVGRNLLRKIHFGVDVHKLCKVSICWGAACTFCDECVYMEHTIA